MRSLFVILPLVTLGWLATVNTVKAQVSSDGTLSTTVSSPDGSNFTIDNGDRAGGNLFHSFSQFSVPNGGSAVFQNPVDVQNIISRVTGGSISNINGLIQAQGSANLFLLNPAGIVFGPNASLNIGGSFFATTANSLLFGDGVEFSATNLATSPVLSVNIPIGLRFRDNPGSISNQSAFLEVPSQKTLALIGGNVNIVDSGILFAPGGRIELGGLTQAGTVGLNPDNSLSFPDGMARGDVAITNGGVFVNAVEGNSGDINIQAKSFSLSDRSVLFASHDGQGNAGNISVKAQDTVTLDNNSLILSNVGNPEETPSVGNVGNITIEAREVSVTDGSQLQAGFYSNTRGNPGTISIRAEDKVSFQNSSILGDVFPNAEANGSNIDISAKSVSISDGALLNTSNQGQGNAGNITVNAQDTVFLNDGILRTRFSGTSGQAGNIDITTGSLLVSGGGQLTSSTSGQGNAGNITINATGTVSFDGTNNQGNPSGVFSNVGNPEGVNAQGNVGNISIEAREVSVTDGAELQAGFYSNTKGNPGTISIRAEDKVSFQNSSIFGDVFPNAEANGSNIDISAKSVSISDGALLDTRNQGQGNAGSITINAWDTVFLNDGILRTRFSGTSGQAGNINVTTGSLFATNGGLLTSSTSGQGNAGNITIHATGTVSFEGKDSEGNFSGVFSDVNETGVGSGGDISVTAESLLLNGGLLNTNFRGTSGKAGNINIKMGSLFVNGGGQLNSNTYATGDAGNININATGTVSFDGTDSEGNPSGVFSNVGNSDGVNAQGNVGNISIKAREVSVTDGAELQAGFYSNTKGNPGTLSIQAEDKVSFQNGDIFADVFPNAEANGSNIEINVTKGSLFLRDGAELNTNNQGQGSAGNIKIITAKDIRLDNNALITANTKGGQGNIILNSRDLILRRNSNITTNATGTATGGNITITTGNLVAFPKEDSNISANADEGPGGRVSISATRIFGIEFRKEPTEKSDITATSNLGPDFSGNVQIKTPDIDPSQGLIELPENLTDPTDQIAQNPCQKGAGSSFTIIGRGGLPSSPNDSFNSDNIRIDLVKPSTSSSNTQSSTINQPTTQPTAQQIIPAQGWVFNDKGEVVLTAYDPTSTSPQRTSKPTAACPAF
jgi:filamentous hemagglutinin family protein